MSLTQSYEEKRDLLIGQLYKRSNTSVASRVYTKKIAILFGAVFNLLLCFFLFFPAFT